MTTTITPLSPLPQLPEPPSPGSDSKLEFNRKAEAFTIGMKKLGDDLNTAFVPMVNGIITQGINPVINNLDAIRAAPGHAAAAAQSEENARAAELVAVQSATAAAQSEANTQSHADRAEAAMEKLTPRLEADIYTLADISEDLHQIGQKLPTMEAALEVMPALEELGTENIGKIGSITEEIRLCGQHMDAIIAAPENADKAELWAFRAQVAADAASSVSGLPAWSTGDAGKAVIVSEDLKKLTLSDSNMNVAARRAKRAWMSTFLGIDI